MSRHPLNQTRFEDAVMDAIDHWWRSLTEPERGDERHRQLFEVYLHHRHPGCAHRVCLDNRLEESWYCQRHQGLEAELGCGCDAVNEPDRAVRSRAFCPLHMD